jgi:hypothetical protein
MNRHQVNELRLDFISHGMEIQTNMLRALMEGVVLCNMNCRQIITEKVAWLAKMHIQGF